MLCCSVTENVSTAIDQSDLRIQQCCGMNIDNYTPYTFQNNNIAAEPLLSGETLLIEF